MNILKIALLVALYVVFSLYSSEQISLVDAVTQGNITIVQQKIENNEFSDVIEQYNPDDFSSSDWSLLMKAIARLGTLLIEAQSFINTVDASITSAIIPVNLVSTIVSFLYAQKFFPSVAKDVPWWRQIVSKVKGFALSKYFVIPGIAMALLTISGRFFLLSKIRSFFQTNIENQYTIIQLLLKQESINVDHQSHRGETASSLCQDIRSLLHSRNLCPPYTPRVPEKRYLEMLNKIENKVEPVVKTEEKEVSQEKPEYFKRQVAFDQLENGKIPIVFDPGYDILFFGLEKLHPFDTKKYSKIATYLQNQFQISFYDPYEVTDADLELVHTKSYLESLRSSWKLGLIADMPFLALIPASLASRILLRPVRKAVGGTVMAAELAEKYGWSINLSGGYHHAKSEVPVYGGFCILNDAGLAIHKVLEKHPDWKILIIDLDAHQGNGNTDIAKNKKNIAIFDMYNADTWPGDFANLERINFPVKLKAKTEDGNYLQTLQEKLPEVIDQVRPDFIIYNAGTDVYEKDPIGELSITGNGIINRDKFVFEQAKNRNIPIMMMLSGGYHKDSAEIIGRSIENIIQKHDAE